LFVSLNEIDAAVKRAARGIGLSWGLAEEAGRGARWLAAHRIAGPDIVLSALKAHESGPLSAMGPSESQRVWHARAGILSPILAGARFSDEAGCRTGLVLASVICPVMLLPWVAWTANATGQAFELLWPGTRIRVFAEGVDFVGAAAAARGQAADIRIVTIAAALPGEACRERQVGVQVEASTWSCLQQLALRSFVPASERSRLTGAGAGLSDND
jgi:hypothetical protein